MSNFASQLKKLRKEHDLLQKELAVNLGVAQTTIANYEQNIRFPNQEILKKIADYFDVSLDYLLGRTKSKRNSPLQLNTSQPSLSSLATEYLNKLLAGKQAEASELILEAAKNGVKMEDIYLQVFEPTLKRIGKLWELNKISVAKEHYFTSATQTIMSQLYSYIGEREKNKGTFAALAITGDSHNLGARIVADLLAYKGWKTYYLGSNVPTGSVLEIITEAGVDVVGLSITLTSLLNTAQDVIKIIKGASNVKIIVGGQAFADNKHLWKQIGADGYGYNALEAIEVVEKLLN